MDLTVSFTINFAYILYPVAAMLFAWVSLMVVFTLVMASANASNLTHWCQIVGRMLFRKTVFGLSVQWLMRDCLNAKFL